MNLYEARATACPISARARFSLPSLFRLIIHFFQRLYSLMYWFCTTFTCVWRMPSFVWCGLINRTIFFTMVMYSWHITYSVRDLNTLDLLLSCTWCLIEPAHIIYEIITGWFFISKTRVKSELKNNTSSRIIYLRNSSTFWMVIDFYLVMRLPWFFINTSLSWISNV